MISLEHLPEFMGFFFTADFKKDEGAKANLTKKGGDPVARVRELLPALEAAAWNEPALEAAFAAVGAANERKPTDYFAPVRFATSGQGGGAHLLGVLRVLGRDTTLARLKAYAA